MRLKLLDLQIEFAPRTSEFTKIIRSVFPEFYQLALATRAGFLTWNVGGVLMHFEIHSVTHYHISSLVGLVLIVITRIPSHTAPVEICGPTMGKLSDLRRISKGLNSEDEFWVRSE